MVEKIIVLAVTRERPVMFSRLLDSLVTLHSSDKFFLEFCFIENAPTLSIIDQVEAFKIKSGYIAAAICEPRLGIPFARNAALNWALQTDADYLAFIDDDEIAQPDWLEQLYRGARQDNLDMAGGPVVPGVARTTLTLSESLVLKGLQRRARRIAKINNFKRKRNVDRNIAILTNNSLCRLAFLRRTGLQFEQAIGASGGSDTAFFRAAKAAGARTGWVPGAQVAEVIADERLSFGYQFQRGRDQAISHYRSRYRNIGTARQLALSSLFVASKILLGLIRLVAAPFTLGSTFVLAIRAFGSAWGRILALAGKNSNHYQTVRGN